MAEAPTKPGFYWAKWRLCDEGTDDEADFTPSDTWEVVDVFVNCVDRDDPEHLRVFVSGVARGQAVENFFWGPGPLPPPDATPTPSRAERGEGR